MTGEVLHIGLTVRNLERSIEFYRDILGLEYLGQMLMEGEETDLLFGRKNSRAKVAYLNGSKDSMAPPIELIEFLDQEIELDQASLFKTSISEVCFKTQDIEKAYQNLKEHKVECLSPPQYFDLSKYGFGRSKAFYFKDPDGIILEYIESL